jgi:membrane dipeptidase
VLPIFVERAFLPERALNRALEMVAGLYRELDEARDAFVLVKNRADLRAVERHDRIGLLLALEGAEALESDPANLLRLFHELGVRIIALTWHRPTRFADDADDGAGLSRDGVALIRAMNELNVLLDVSHLTDNAFEPAVAFAQGAVIATSSGARAVAEVPRNLTDAQIYAIGATGGMIGVAFAPELVGGADPDRIAAQVDYIGGLIGRDKVGLGPGFLHYLPPETTADLRETGVDALSNMASAREFPAVAEALMRAGMGQDVVRDVMGSNAMRFFKKVLP